MPRTLHIASNPEALATVVAAWIEDLAGDAIAARGAFRLALSGGRTPHALYARLADASRRARIEWKRCVIGFADERAVPADDADSNYALAVERLVTPLGIPATNVLRMEADDPDLLAAARRYERVVETPFDLVLLGIGEDGHVASIFPGSSVVGERTRRVAAVIDSPKPPARRLTLTPRALVEARAVAVLATGQAKATAVAAALAAAGADLAIPARLVRERDWYLDREAAGALRGPHEGAGSASQT